MRWFQWPNMPWEWRKSGVNFQVFQSPGLFCFFLSVNLSSTYVLSFDLGYCVCWFVCFNSVGLLCFPLLQFVVVVCSLYFYFWFQLVWRKHAQQICSLFKLLYISNLVQNQMQSDVLSPWQNRANPYKQTWEFCVFGWKHLNFRVLLVQDDCCCFVSNEEKEDRLCLSPFFFSRLEMHNCSLCYQWDERGFSLHKNDCCFVPFFTAL